MKEVTCDSWKHFQEKLFEIESSEKYGKRGEIGSIYGPIFRGHASACWKLETTLDRYLKQREFVLNICGPHEYHDLMKVVCLYIDSLTEEKFYVPRKYKERLTAQAPVAYEFMIYLRHHGFPSPLLDWTQSPYIAAFFAFENAFYCDRVAIFSYREDIGQGKSTCLDDPHVRSYGPTIVTHKRHFQQQCQYTSCFQKINKTSGENGRKLIYACHEDVKFDGETCDILYKYTIPISERQAVLKNLDVMGINKFSLFGNEESLAETLAFREIELDILRKAEPEKFTNAND